METLINNNDGRFTRAGYVFLMNERVFVIYSTQARFVNQQVDYTG
jgi:hypothetical protein